jgi:NAD(P)-dependent dehydrogenase (short-subunit alcohol dehydrogenase family)
METPVVLITGGLTGIGRAAAAAFARKGAKVVVAGRREEAGKALVKELRAFGSEAEFINTDVRKEDDVRNMVVETIARFGRLDVAVNNAGTEGAGGPITEQTAESFAGSKHAVEGITKSVALEVAKSGIRVNAVAPGPTDTGMLTRFSGTAEKRAAMGTAVPLGRLGLAEEVADGIVFIASEEARFITGHVLAVDGGKSAS